MANSFDFFDKIYCINLDEQTKRWESVQKEFDKIGILNKVERFKGIKKEPWPLGCNLSFLEIIKTASKQNLNNVLIFEDDVKFVNWNNSFFNNAISNLRRENWEYLRIGYNMEGFDIKFEKISNNLIKVKKGSDIRSTHAHAVNHVAYKFIIEELEKEYQKNAIDMWTPKYFDCYCVVPLMALQNQGKKPYLFTVHYLTRYKFRFFWNKLPGKKLIEKILRGIVRYSPK